MATTYRVNFRLHSDPARAIRTAEFNLDQSDAESAWDRRISMEDVVAIQTAYVAGCEDADDVDMLSYYVTRGPVLRPGPHPAAAMDAYVRMVRAIGDGFHPDTRGADYANLPAPYTPELVDETVESAGRVCDPYIVALDVLNGGTGHGDA
jgi:hypothetical protein